MLGRKPFARFGERLTEVMQVSVTEAEKGLIEAEANETGRSVSGYIRNKIFGEKISHGFKSGKKQKSIRREL